MQKSTIVAPIEGKIASSRVRKEHTSHVYRTDYIALIDGNYIAVCKTTVAGVDIFAKIVITPSVANHVKTRKKMQSENAKSGVLSVRQEKIRAIPKLTVSLLMSWIDSGELPKDDATFLVHMYNRAASLVANSELVTTLNNEQESLMNEYMELTKACEFDRAKTVFDRVGEIGAKLQNLSEIQQEIPPQAYLGAQTPNSVSK